MKEPPLSTRRLQRHLIAGTFTGAGWRSSRIGGAGRWRQIVRGGWLAAMVLVLNACGGVGAKSSSPVLLSIGAGLRGSSGLSASVYARGLRHVAAIALDGQGRVWVATSGASSHGSDAVFMVGAARAKPRKVIAKIRGPLGLQWLGGSLYVSSLEGVTRFSGLGTDGLFTRRKVVLKGPVAGAENNNVVVGPHGRLVMGVSAMCDHCASSPRYSAAIVTFRADGTDLKVLAARIRAPFGLVYKGSVLYATFNQRDDLGAKTPGDWLAEVHGGQDWRFPGCYGQGGSGCDGVPSPLASLDRHAAAGGVAVLGNVAIVAEWNVARVVAVALAGHQGRTHTFVSGIKHPLPVVGLTSSSVLIGDWETGTIYRISASAAALR